MKAHECVYYLKVLSFSQPNATDTYIIWLYIIWLCKWLGKVVHFGNPFSLSINKFVRSYSPIHSDSSSNHTIELRSLSLRSFSSSEMGSQRRLRNCCPDRQTVFTRNVSYLLKICNPKSDEIRDLSALFTSRVLCCC